MSVINVFSKFRHGEREIILDLETTGLMTSEGHRVLEVAAIELIGGRASGLEFHARVNPEHPISASASAVHGITDDKVSDLPPFAAIARQLRDFIGSDRVVITCRTMADGYTLDIAFLTMELERAGLPALRDDQWRNVRRWAEAVFGEKSATLDKICDRYGVSRRERDEQGHSALIDARLLAEVYPLLAKDFRASLEQKSAVAARAARAQGGKAPGA